MNVIKRCFLLFYLLSKRLYKKVSFLIILLFLVLVTAFVGTALNQESSMLKIAIVKPDVSGAPEDVILSLTQSDGAAEYKLYSKQEATELLRKGKSDAVLEFEDNFDQSLLSFISGESETAPVRVTVRENNTFIKLSLERVYAELYPLIANNLYYDYAQEKLQADNKDELKYYFDNVKRNGDIIEFSYYNSEDKVENTNYLVTPLRGILAIILIFCSMASALYFLNDCENGNMDAIPISRRWFLQIMYIFSGSFNIAIFVVLALISSGLFGNFITEIPVMLLYVIASVGFSSLLSGIFAKTGRMASVMPILTIAMLAVCPIFLNSELPVVPCLFPTYWYLKAVYNTSIIPVLILYCFIVYLLSVLIRKKRRYLK